MFCTWWIQPHICYLVNHQAFSLFYSTPFVSAAADSLWNDRIYSIQHLTWASLIHLWDVRHSASCANAFNKSPLRNGQVLLQRWTGWCQLMRYACCGDDGAFNTFTNKVTNLRRQVRLCEPAMPENARGAWRRQARLRRPMPLPVSCSAPVKVPALVKSVKYFKLMVPDDTFYFYFFAMQVISA